MGVRDFAILMLLARLGLRAVEVSRIDLNDLYWRVGEIEIDGKGHERARLPLPKLISSGAPEQELNATVTSRIHWAS